MSSRNTEKSIKFLMGLKHRSDPHFNGEPFDIVIPVLGPTGVGKSTFINSLLESIGKTERVKVGHRLESTTSQMNPVVIEFGQGVNGFTNPNSDNKGRLVLVDTPGFEDTYVDDGEILRRISVWLGLSYAISMKLGGVIYLHDITQHLMLGSTRRDLIIFQKLIGADALGCVVLGTTKWALIDSAVGAQRQEELKSQFWKEMIDSGSRVVSVCGQDTPREIINSILNDKLTKSKVEFLMIQSELVQMRRSVPQTAAGQALKYSLDELIKLQKPKVENFSDDDFDKGRKELDRLCETAKELKVPLGARIKKFFRYRGL